MEAQTASQWAQFAAMGDINGDGYIDQKDVALLQAAWLSTLGSPNWNPRADLNGDGIVNIDDWNILQSNLGLNIWDYFGLKKPMPRMTLILVGVGFAAFVGIVLGTAYYLTKKS
jgi:hypothetical protein